jgi:hypothetical protein
MACGLASATQRPPSKWNPFWQTISFGLAGIVFGFVVVFAFGAAGGGAPQVSRVICSFVQHVLPSLLGNKPAGQLLGGGGGAPQVPAATASAAQHCPFTSVEGG